MLAAVVSILIFAVALVLILSERIDRTIVALAGAMLMVLAGKVFGFYDEHKAVGSVDFNTIGLLLGMMILVAMLARTGFFEYLAILAGQQSKGQPWRLLVILGLTTGFVSMFLDNVTTIILMVPITLQIASLLRLSPIPLLIGEALLSNSMGMATLVGDPPNIIIGAHTGLSFLAFLTHLGPIALIAAGVTLLALRITFRRELAQKPANVESLMRMDPRRSIKEAGDMRKILIVIGLVVIAFFLHGLLHLQPATVALAGAALALLAIRPPVEEILHGVEWPVLLFFAGLFAMVGGLESANVLQASAEALSGLSDYHPAVLGVALLWLSAGISALVDNIPFTIAALPVVDNLSESAGTGDMLWWALALGAGIGGNGTPIGSTAGVVAVHMSEKTETPITLRTWLASGTLATVTSAILASAVLLLFNSAFI